MFFSVLFGEGRPSSPRYSSDAPAVTLVSAALIGAEGHMTVIGRDMSGHATVIAFKVHHSFFFKKKAKKAMVLKPSDHQYVHLRSCTV